MFFAASPAAALQGRYIGAMVELKERRRIRRKAGHEKYKRRSESLIGFVEVRLDESVG